MPFKNFHWVVKIELPLTGTINAIYSWWNLIGYPIKKFCMFYWYSKSTKSNQKVIEQALVVQCCNLSLNAAVWANGAQGVDLVHPRSQERQPLCPCACIPLFSHSTRVLERWKNKEKRVASWPKLWIVSLRIRFRKANSNLFPSSIPR